MSQFAGLPLIDRYDLYQCLMDYWDEVLQDDAYLVLAEGWKEAARPRVLDRGAPESPDLTVGRVRYKMDLLPPDLVVARYFLGERDDVERMLAEDEAIGRKLAAFLEENAGEYGPLGGATSATGKVTQAAVKVRLRAVGVGSEDPEEHEALEICLGLMKSHAKARRATKAAQVKLDAKVLARYAVLDAAEVASIVVRDKWMTSIETAILEVVDRLTGELVDRLTVLEDRYAESLRETLRQVEQRGTNVELHLKRIGVLG